MKGKNNGMLDEQCIRDVLFYAHRYANTRVVFYIEAGLLRSARKTNEIVKDIVYLLNSNIKVVVIPGVEKGIKEEGKNDTSVTKKEEIAEIQQTMFEAANALIAGFATYRQTAVVGNWIRARGFGVVNDIDLHHSGVVERIDIKAIDTLLEDGVVPILSVVGWSYIGKPYYMQPKSVAARASVLLGAKKLFFLLEEDVRQNIQKKIGDENGLTRRLGLVRARRAVEEKRDYCDLLQMAVSALTQTKKEERTLTRVHILGGKHSTAILGEIFSNSGIGFMVYSDEYDAIEPMEEKDIPRVLEILAPGMERGVLLRRNAEDLAKQLQDFYVYKTDGSTQAVAALHNIGEGCAEIAALASKENEEKQHNARFREREELSIGQKLMRALLLRAKERGYEKVFVFTQRAGDWFERCGFVQVNPMTELPRERMQRYRERGGRSRVYLIRAEEIEAGTYSS